MSRVCAHLRQGAMKRQLESFYSNIVTDKSHKCKLVYKKNTRVDGKLEFYVAKTVVKGYNLKLCFNYGKPFQQWSYSNPSNHFYLLQCVSFMRFNNQNFSQKRVLCVQKGIGKHGDALRSCRQMKIYSLDIIQGYFNLSISGSLLSSR